MSSDRYAEILRRVYPDDVATTTAARVAELVASACARVTPDDHRPSERDIVLITYGDNLREPDATPLQALRRFYNAHLGDLVNSIHILPFHPYTSDDGFSVVDYDEVDPQLGTWADIEELGGDARLMFDAVVNHVSRSSPWFQGYLAGDQRYADWFIDVDPATDLSQVTRPRSSPLLTEFVDADGRARHIWTTFSDDQIDVNVHNPEVLLALLRVLADFVVRGAKYIRLDAIAFLWKEIGTTCLHLPQTHDIVRLMRRVVEDIDPSTLIVTETNVPHDENVSYMGDGHDEAHMVYNFALPPLVAYSLLNGNARKLQEWARGLVLPSDRTCFFNFTASHDGVGVRPVENILTEAERDVLMTAAVEHGGAISYKRNPDGSESPYELNCSYVDLLTPCHEDNNTRAARLLASQAIALAMPGIPGIYIHSLLGSRNDNRAVACTGQNRSINRTKLDVTQVVDALADEGTLRSRVFAGMASLLRARAGEPAFHPYGSFSFPGYDERVFAVLREHDNRRVLFLVNVSDERVTIDTELSIEMARELLTGETVPAREISLPAFGILWLELV